MDKKIRVRYAPSPTGFLHIGNTRTALMNYLFAKHYNGSFIVRIEDTDFERNVNGAIESQFENLEWLGIFCDESYLNPNKNYGEYMQSKKLNRYVEVANDLIKKRYAYKCYCTQKELEKEKEIQLSKGIVATKYSGKCRELIGKEINKEFSIRFLVEPNKVLVIDDMVRGRIEFNTNDIGDFVIVKSNSVATYNFAVVVDDHDMKISHVIRGEEHISNTPKQLLIYNSFNWETPIFCHLTLIIDETKKKLSKRSPNSFFFIEEYKNKGYLPEAIFNYISLLGWSPKNEEEIYDKKTMIKIFDEKNFTKSPSTFDMNKMKWFNSRWIKKMDDVNYLNFVKKYIDDKTKKLNNLDNILLLYKNEINFGEEIKHQVQIFEDNKIIKNELVELFKSKFNYSIEMIKNFQKELKELDLFNDLEIKKIIKEIGNKYNLNGKELFMPIRICTTLSEHGPELAKVIWLLGKDKVISNISLLINKIGE